MRPAPPESPLIDTIVAPITAAGFGQRAAVRLSGPEAWALAEEVLQTSEAPRPGRSVAARLDLGDGIAADVTLLAFRAPRSLTGEDVIEFHLVGWPVLVTDLVARLVAAGARPAERGEFTRRAVATGRMDLAAGLAVGRLVGARDAEEAAAAAFQLAGGLAARHAELREALLSTRALIEAHVDFEEEDTESVGEDDVRAGLLAARDIALRLARECVERPPSDGETDIALFGPPNAGKSALFLALCPGADTTVSPVAGTTRDTLEARVVQGGRRFRVLDGPGIDDQPEGEVLDALDRRAMELYLDGLPRYAIVLHVVDATVLDDPHARARRIDRIGERPCVDVANKCDLLPTGTTMAAVPGLPVSALRGIGLDALWAAIAAAAPAPRAPDLATRGELRALELVGPLLAEALAEPRPGALSGVLPEVSMALREALAHLDAEAQLAADLDEEVLDRIFASFCVGK